MRSAIFGLLGVVALLGLMHCGDGESPVTTGCEDLIDSCADEGITRCSASDDAVEACLVNADGCLVWSETMSCGGTGSCVDGACECEDECVDDGTTRCAGDVLESCEEAGSGCLYWAESSDCADDGQHCDDSGETAECTSDCSTTCQIDSEECQSNTIMRCVEDETGCSEWVVERACADEGLTCVRAGDGVECVAGCVDECDVEGHERCSEDFLDRCVMGASGCLVWEASRDCSAEGRSCETDGTTASCACPFVCEPGEGRCEGDIVQSCMLADDLCWSWVDVVDCAEFGVTCDDTAAVADCTAIDSGTCAESLVIDEFPFRMSGSSFADDLGDDQTFSHGSCERRTSSAEVVLAVDVVAGDRILMTEHGGVNIVMNVQDDCDPAGPCLLSVDDWGGGYLPYDVVTTGRHYIIVESSGPDTGLEDYDIEIVIAEAEVCGDDVDNDLDELVDCDDADCFGVAPHCTAETNCQDGEDNDADGAADCADSDCTTTLWCQDNQGLWELFGTGDLCDLVGSTITFTPDGSDTNGYTWTTSGGVDAFPVTPGSGTVSSVLSLSDDDFEEWTFTELPSFTFYEQTYSVAFIGSNGFITFGEGSTAPGDILDNHFAQPGVSGFRRDLDPSRGGTVTVDETSERLAVTFEAVPRWDRWTPGVDPNSFQMVLNADGTIELHYLMSNVVNALVGIASGVGDGDLPPETNFVP